MNTYMLIGIVLVVLIIIFILTTYNQLIRLNNNVKEAFSTMDVYLKKRWDLIPNIVETVKGYAEHEKTTLEEIIALRSGTYDSLSDKEKLETNTKIATNIPKIMLLAEAYPKLKADKNFLDLQKNLSKIEDEIAQSRKYYNATIREYNNKVEMIPSNIVASIFGYKKKDMFMATEQEKENVQVNINDK